MKGLIKHFVLHRTAANLGMVLVILLGAAALFSLNVQLWPTYTVKRINVDVAWRGASAGTMDRLVGRVLDNTLNAISSVRNVRTTSSPGSTYSSVRFEDDTDMQIALSEIQSAVNSITTFPPGAETPVVSLSQPTERVARLLVSGPFSDATRRQLAYDIVSKFRTNGIGNVQASGVVKQELVVEIDPLLARQYQVPLATVTSAVKAALESTPGGSIDSDTSRQTIRTLSTDSLDTIGNTLITTKNGKLRLSDLAEISSGAPSKRVQVVFPEGNGFFIEFQRNVSEDVITLSKTIRATVASLRAELPQTVNLRLYDVRADQITGRIKLLSENALVGMVLVAAMLFLFLNSRAALWVVVSIFTAFSLSFIIMWATGQTINMVSVFAMVMILGIIVDDGIVVAENIVTRQGGGSSPAQGAVIGAMQMWRPVLTATLTTIAAFAPIIFLTDVFGTYVKAIPYFVCAALIASLVECFLLMPGHLRHGDKAKKKQAYFRTVMNDGLHWFVQNPFRTLINSAYNYRYVSLAVAFGFLALAVILATTNAVRFQFWLNPQSNYVFANVSLTPGATRADTRAALEKLWQGLNATEKELGYEKDELVAATFGLVGSQFSRQDSQADDNIGGIFAELTDNDGQRISSDEFVKRWQAAVPPIADMVSLQISQQQSGPDGADIQVRAKAEDLDSLKRAVDQIETSLRETNGVTNIRNSLSGSATELEVTVTQTGQERGFTSENIGRQLFAAFNGVKTNRLAHNDSFLDVIVRYKTDGSVKNVLSVLPIQGPDGERHNFFQVAEIDYGQGENLLQRRDSGLVATVSADVDRNVVDASAVWKHLDETVLPQIALEEDVEFNFDGKRKESDRAFSEITISLVIGLTAIYCILAWSMESFLLPFGIMLILPLGAAGAVFGHFVLDYKMTMLSLVALVALFGILVNDSIILFEEILGRRKKGAANKPATIDGYAARFRPVFLTSLTTIAGLAPLILEQSYQAQFLIPIAITITWGLGIATLLSFILIPAIFAIADDVSRIRGEKTSK